VTAVLHELDGVVDPTLNDWVDTLVVDSTERGLSRGFQAYVALDGMTRCDVAWGFDGLDEPLKRTNITAIHCAGKPLCAVAIGRLVAGNALAFDDEIGTYLPEIRSAALRRATIRQLLTHQAGLFHVADRVTHVLTDDEIRSSVLALEPRGQIGDRAIYAEFASWYLLGLLLRAVSGESVRSFLQREMAAPIGTSTELCLGYEPRELSEILPRLAANSVSFGERTAPRLLDLSKRFLTSVRPAGGAYATMRGLGRFYEELGASWDGTGALLPTDTLRTMVRERTETAFDPGMRRRCAYGLGFMVDLADHGFGQGLHHDSFGHSGDRGTTFAFHDPSKRLTVAIQYIGIIDPTRSIWRRRELVVEDLLTRLALDDTHHAESKH
jgi:CubicO group peptidase (beta-lactamase class C family)